MSQAALVKTSSGVRWQLFIMMVLEIFIWGAWLPLIFSYLPSLGFSDKEAPGFLAKVIPQGIVQHSVAFMVRR